MLDQQIDHRQTSPSLEQRTFMIILINSDCQQQRLLIHPLYLWTVWRWVMGFVVQIVKKKVDLCHLGLLTLRALNLQIRHTVDWSICTDCREEWSWGSYFHVLLSVAVASQPQQAFPCRDTAGWARPLNGVMENFIQTDRRSLMAGLSLRLTYHEAPGDNSKVRA